MPTRIFTRSLLVLALVGAGSCVHLKPAPKGPESVARDFAQRLASADLDGAFALSLGLTRDEFGTRYQNASARTARAELIAQALEGGANPQGAVELKFSGQGWRIQEEPSVDRTAEPKKALTEFLDAAERRDFPAAWAMLSARWRSRYTPARLQTDFDAEPEVKDRLARARAALNGAWQIDSGSAGLVVGLGRTLKLEREGVLWRLAALE